MDLRPNKNQDEKMKNFFLSQEDQNSDRSLESSNETLAENHGENALCHWQGPEYELYPKDNRWYMIAAFVLLAIIIYALITDSPIMAITFILIGVVGYMYLEKDPEVFDFQITEDGVSAGKNLYEFDNIQSFWIFYKEPHRIILSLHLKEGILPYIHIPIHQEDPEHIREIISSFIPEIKQQPSMIDTIERLLHI